MDLNLAQNSIKPSEMNIEHVISAGQYEPNPYSDEAIISMVREFQGSSTTYMHILPDTCSMKVDSRVDNIEKEIAKLVKTQGIDNKLMSEAQYEKETAVLDQIMTLNLRGMKDRTIQNAQKKKKGKTIRRVQETKPSTIDGAPNAGSNSSVVKFLNRLQSMLLTEPTVEEPEEGYRNMGALLASSSNNDYSGGYPESLVRLAEKNSTLKSSIRLTEAESRALNALKTSRPLFTLDFILDSLMA